MCHDEDTYYDLKVKIQVIKGLQGSDIDQWQLYRPGNLLDKRNSFIPKTGDQRLPPKHRIDNTDKESGDPDIDIIVMSEQHEQHEQAHQKKDIETLTATGNLPTLPSAQSELAS